MRVLEAAETLEDSHKVVRMECVGENGLSKESQTYGQQPWEPSKDLRLQRTEANSCLEVSCFSRPSTKCALYKDQVTGVVPGLHLFLKPVEPDALADQSQFLLIQVTTAANPQLMPDVLDLVLRSVEGGATGFPGCLEDLTTPGLQLA